MAVSSLADRCECGYQQDLPPTIPDSVVYTGNDSLRADYHCRRCGRHWWTAWGATAAGWPPLTPGAGRDAAAPVLEQLQ